MGVIGGGDWVDYGSTRVQLPLEHGCTGEHDYGDDGQEADVEHCPHYQEQPKCERHGCYLSENGVCDDCYAEWQQEEEGYWESQALMCDF